ncbi:glycosyltransferase family 2 protein [Candidatus Leptofilum sp.]|uniref:glycosyltransferase family 2 protein n=1 Tax=Candidatus Leptofilum sp. TaxID=3241576 RepID=UPI003B5AA8E0
MQRSLTVSMPAFNEAENIPGMVADVLRVMPQLANEFELIVVDDGSRDETAVVTQQLARQHPQLKLVQHGENKGYGTAVLTGLTHASKELVFFTDADRQFDLAEIEKLLAHIETADLVVGYRAPRRDPFMRRLNGKGWSWLVTLLFGYTARDIDCAFKLMRREVIARLQNDIGSGGATFSAEFLVRAKQAGFKIVEVPIEGHRPRVAGNPTGANLRVITRAFKELMQFRLGLWREAKLTVKSGVNSEQGTAA